MTNSQMEDGTDPKHDHAQRDIEVLYRLALLISGDEQTASKMVTEAFARPDTPIEADLTDRYKRFSRILAGVGERRQAENQQEVSALSSTVAEKLLSTKFPVAFAALTSSEQILLLIAHQQSFDVRQAVGFLGITSDQFTEELDAARARVLDLFIQSLSSTERGLFLDEDKDEWLGSAVTSSLELLVPEVPIGLRDSAVAAKRKSAVDRNAKASGAGTSGVSVRKTLIAAVTLAGVLFASLWWLAAPSQPKKRPVRDLLELTAAKAGSIELDLTGASEQVAEEYIFDKTGRQLVVPRFTDATLSGATTEKLAKDLVVPILSYVDNLGMNQTPFAVFVYQYQMLGNAESGGPRIASAVLRSLDDEVNFRLVPTETDTLLVWRHRTNIYVAVGNRKTINSLSERTELQGPLGSR